MLNIENTDKFSHNFNYSKKLYLNKFYLTKEHLKKSYIYLIFFSHKSILLIQPGSDSK
jgi:hypothetical protein